MAASGALSFRSELTAAQPTTLPWFEALLTAQAAALGLMAPSLGVHSMNCRRLHISIIQRSIFFTHFICCASFSR
jgi:hypothetical protein